MLFQLTPAEGRQNLSDLQSGDVAMPDIDEEWINVHGGPTRAVRVRIIRPRGAMGSLPVVLYIHGAGWVYGDAHTHDRLARELAVGVGAAVVFPDGRVRLPDRSAIGRLHNWRADHRVRISRTRASAGVQDYGRFGAGRTVESGVHPQNAIYNGHPELVQEIHGAIARRPEHAADRLPGSPREFCPALTERCTALRGAEQYSRCAVRTSSCTVDYEGSRDRTAPHNSVTRDPFRQRAS